MKVHLRSAAELSSFGDAYGYGRVHRSLLKHASGSGIEFVERKQDADLEICLSLPSPKWRHHMWWGFEPHERQVIYVMWETTALPIGWADVLNESMAVFTASEFCREVMRTCGVKRPIFVVPHGVDTEFFPVIERDFNASPLVFLWQGMNFRDRKGSEYVRQAYLELNLQDAWLVEKIYPTISVPGPRFDYHSERRSEIRALLSPEEYIELLRNCHVSVNSYRGEGFGLMPLECAATGMPTILTDWSGPRDYIRRGFFLPIKYQLSPPGESYIATSPWNDFTEQFPGQDAIPDIADLKEKMLWCYEHRMEAQALGRRASMYVQEVWNWTEAMKTLHWACSQVKEL